MARQLKVFRTAIGFHDAYVAAPSMKAALEAWGASRNLFASGAAELVTDPKLAAKALARPGEVLKVLRGTPDEQIAALGKATASSKTKRAPVKARAGPKPSRAKLDEAEAALTEVAKRFDADEEELARAEAALRAKRKTLDAARSRATKTAEARRDREQATYDQALDAWKGA